MKRLTLATLGALAVLMSGSVWANYITITPPNGVNVTGTIPYHKHFALQCLVRTGGDDIPIQVYGYGITLNSNSANTFGTFLIKYKDSDYLLNFEGSTGNSGGSVSINNNDIGVSGPIKSLLVVSCTYHFLSK